MVWMIILGVVIFLILFIIESIYLAGHFKQKRARTVFEKSHYEFSKLGVGGTGFIGIKNHKLTVFKTPTIHQNFKLAQLFVFTSSNRLDFSTEFAPLTPSQRAFGVIFKPEDQQAIINYFKQHNVRVTSMADLQQAVSELVNEQKD